MNDKVVDFNSKKHEQFSNQIQKFIDENVKKFMEAFLKEMKEKENSLDEKEFHPYQTAASLGYLCSLAAPLFLTLQRNSIKKYGKNHIMSSMATYKIQFLDSLETYLKGIEDEQL